MKKILSVILAVLTLGGVACAGGERPIGFDGLPGEAQQFINEYFPGREVAFVKEEGHLDKSYDVLFVNGDTVEFDGRGAWTEVVCRESGVPAGIVPRLIAEYVDWKYPETVIVEISKDRNEYDVELSTGLNIEFDRNFNVTDMER